VAVLAVSLIVLQVLSEGLRWQMIPLCLTGGVLVLLSLLLRQKLSDVAVQPSQLWRFTSVAAISTGACALAFASALPILLPVPRLPRPSGPYEIGTLTYHWIDNERAGAFSAPSSDRRELMVQLWYPAAPSPNLRRAPYVVSGRTFAPLARLLHLPKFFFSHLQYASTNASLAAPVAEDPRQYPVLIFSHGRGGFRQHSTFQVEELVSHGYVVAAIDHPYAGSEVIFPDGRRAMYDARMTDRNFKEGIFTYLGQDAVFVLNQLEGLNKADPNHLLTGHLDMEHVGIFGLSLGGIVASEACLLDQRFRACLIMDVYMPREVVKAGLRQPTMWISRDTETQHQERWSTADIDELQTTMRSVFERLPGDGYIVLIAGAFHINFSDFPLIAYAPLARRLGVIGPVGSQKAHKIINAYSLAFFDTYLKNKSAGFLKGPPVYPEVSVETKQP